MVFENSEDDNNYSPYSDIIPDDRRWTDLQA